MQADAAQPQMRSARRPPCLVTLWRPLITGLLVVACLVSVACGSSTPWLLDTATPTDAQRETFEEMQAQVAQVRALEPLREVYYTFLHRESWERFVRDVLYSDVPALDTRIHRQPVYELLGLISPEQDLVTLSARLQGSAGAVYDPTQDAVFLIDGERELDTCAVVVLAHEFVHALQYQHSDLAEVVKGTCDEWDARLAVAALVEGDATVTMQEYASTLGQAADVCHIDPANCATSKGHDIPEALRLQFCFPYQTGAEFVRALLAEGDWAAVDDAYERPPHTTEQILHPEKYLAGEGRSRPAPRSLTGELGEGWRGEGSNELGEFLLGLHLRTQLTAQEAANAAAGWGGDRWTLYSDGGDGRLLLLQIEWDSPEDLDEFFEIYLRWLDARSAGAWKALGDEAALWDGDQQSIYVSKRGGSATLLFSSDRAALAKARLALRLP